MFSFGQTSTSTGLFLKSHTLLVVFIWIVLVGVNCENLTKISTKISTKSVSIRRNATNTESYRLPSSNIPYHYNLEVMPVLDIADEDLKLFSCPSKITIFIECHENTRNITIHSNNITITEDSIRVTNSAGGGDIGIESFEYVEDLHFFIIHLNQELVASNKYEIYIEFVTHMPEDRLNGLYLDWYIGKFGERRYTATTLFAPIHSRRAFPNFDEPQLKASYNITIGRKQHYQTLSNMNLLETIPNQGRFGWVWDKYNQSVKISSYIVAFIVCDFYYAETKMGDKSVRVYATPDLIDKGAGEYGANITSEILSYFEDYFQSTYPISKMYSIALPQFFFNAMENWGLITYKEPILLYLAEETPEVDRYRVNYVVSHELAHQFFGNLVTPIFWTYVWLKEGFATYYGHFGLNRISPELEPWKSFTPSVLQLAMEFDTSNDSHPLENEPENTTRILDIYTRIPYEKGASILRMTASFMGENAFQRSMQNYLKNLAFDSAHQDTLFEIFQGVVNEENIPIPTSMKEILDSWTRQSGLPLVRVRLDEHGHLYFTQELFFEDFFKINETRLLNTSWWIPVTLFPKPETEIIKPGTPETLPDLWIPKDSNFLFNTTVYDTSGLVLVNPSTVGYYRVYYEEPLIDRIYHQLNTNHTIIREEARSQILDDYFKLSNAKYLPVTILFDLTKYMDKEIGYTVWKTLTTNMRTMFNLYYGSEDYTLLQKYFLPKLMGSLSKIGNFSTIDGELKSQVILRGLLHQWACKFNSKSCLDFSTQSLNNFIQNPMKDPLDPNLRQSVYCSSVAHTLDSEKNFEFLLDRYKSTHTTKFQKAIYLRALACSKCDHLLARLLDKALNRSPDFTFNDRPLLIEYVAANPHAKTFIIDFLDVNLEKLIKDKTMKDSNVGNAVLAASEFFKTESELQKVQDFYSKESKKLLKAKAVQKNLNKSVKKIEANMKWVVETKPVISQWLRHEIPHLPIVETHDDEICTLDNSSSSISTFKITSMILIAFLIIFN